MSTPLSLRHARESDSRLLLDWRNDPGSREASGNRAGVTTKEHAAWFEAVLADPDRHLLIAEAGGAAVGQVRLERRRGYRYELSVSVDREHRGQGLGATLIAGACEWAWLATDAAAVDARVREENQASLRAFAGAGFRASGPSSKGFLTLELTRPEPGAPDRPLGSEHRLPFLG